MQRLGKWLNKHLLELGVILLLIVIPLYPKFPLIDIWQTWIYIRMEDFLVAAVVLIWLMKLRKGEVKLKTPLVWPILLYWLIGGISLFNALFIARRPAHFFPHLALLHYLRRIEYMIVFLIVASSIKDLGVLKRYLWVIFMVVALVCLYGFGQRLWGFPAILTMNEEFSKGLALYLPSTARLSSTFAGHYDLAAFLVLVIALSGSMIFTFRNWGVKFILLALTVASFVLLLLTASRISFFAYLLAISLVLFFQKKKLLILPVVLISFYLMKQLGGGTSVRFGKTFRVERVVFDVKTGRPIATLEEFTAPPTPTATILPPGVPTPKPKPASTGGEDLPLGSGYLPLPGKREPLPLAKLPQTVTLGTGKPGEAPLILKLEEMKVATLSSEIATTSANFLLAQDYFVQKAIVYDISFTTRFQGEWPLAWQAFKRNILLGSGYSSVSLATDNDYLRSLGETGILGFLSFWGILFVISLLIRQILLKSQSVWLRGLAIAVIGGLAGLLLNAVLIDVFEASKVAFIFWMLVGMLAGLANLFPDFARSLWQDGWEIFTSWWLSHLVLLIVGLAVFIPMLSNYFVADDFVWLKWASLDKFNDVKYYFFDAKGFFYRPLAKMLFYFLQPIFNMQPLGYHLISLSFHFISVLAVYWLALKLSKQKLVAFLSSFFFLIHPIHEESVFWISSFSTLMAATFYLLAALAYFYWRNQADKRKYLFWFLSLLFFTLSLSSYEVAVTLPLLLIFYDWIYHRRQFNRKALISFLPFLVLTGLYLYLRQASGAHGLSGDYNYNLKKLPFNFLGNFFGYFGELIFSYPFVPIYQKMRAILRFRQALAGIVVLAGLIGLAWLRSIIERRKIKLNFDQTLVFGLGWMVITLLPFLGLGNMAERYAYLSSFGYVLILASLLNQIRLVIEKRKGVVLATFFLLICLIGMSKFYLAELARANQDWFEAGEICRKIQLTLPSQFKEFPDETTLYFAEIPIRHGLAWVFPVGLKEAFLFIYRNETIKFYQMATLEGAWRLHEKTIGPTWVFVFRDGELKKAIK